MRKKSPKIPAEIKAKQATVAALLQSATHYLGETSLPFVILIGGRMLTNTEQLHARAIVHNTARLLDKCEELEIERTAERLIDWGGEK
jgi:hypothetical protein